MGEEILIKRDQFSESESKLRQISCDLETSSNSINNIGNTLIRSWNGKSGKLFGEKNKQLGENIKILSENIDKLRLSISGADKDYEEMETQIIRNMNKDAGFKE